MTVPNKELVVDAKVETIHIERLDSKDDFNVTIEEAIAAEHAENTGAIAALKTHPKAVFWSVVISMCIVMEAYDFAMIGNLFAQPAFQRKFGVYVPATGGYQIPASWQTGCSQAAQVGMVIGVLICGQVLPLLGFKVVTIGALAAQVAVIFAVFFAETLPVLLVGQLLCGIVWGHFNSVAMAYASEVAPVPLRGILTMYNQICWCSGQLVASGILYCFVNRQDKWAYKIPFAIQWAWPIPLLILLPFAPESPWWLVRVGRLEDAAKAVSRLEGQNSGRAPSDVVAMMHRTIEIERKQTEGASYAACFRGTDRRRTLLAMMMFMFQPCSGLLVGNQATYFFTVAGLDAKDAFALGLGNSGLQLTAVVACWFLISFVDRRHIYLSGVSFQTILCLLTGIVASLKPTTATLWVQSAFLMAVYASYGLTVGPMTFTLVAEMGSVELRAPTVSIARAMYFVAAIPLGILTTFMLNPTAMNLAGKSSFLWAGTGAIVFICVYFFLPETRGRNYRQLDILFHRRVPARRFKATLVEDTADD